jgi:hypothetical protein
VEKAMSVIVVLRGTNSIALFRHWKPTIGNKFQLGVSFDLRRNSDATGRNCKSEVARLQRERSNAHHSRSQESSKEERQLSADSPATMLARIGVMRAINRCR